MHRAGRGGRWCSPAIRSSGFLEYAAAPRQLHGPVGRCWYISVSGSTTADPRLDGRAVKRIVYSADAIAQRVRELGAEVTAQYPDGELLVLGLLKGSFIFLGDLVR